MKKLLTIIVTSILMFSVTSCYDKTANYIHIDTDKIIEDIPFGIHALTEIGNGLYYDTNTGIVYWWNGTMQVGYYTTTVPTPYYAPNGLPYRYNSETSTFEEIERQ